MHPPARPPPRAPGSFSPLSPNATPAPSRQPPPVPTATAADQPRPDDPRRLSPSKPRQTPSTSSLSSAYALPPPAPLFTHANSSTGSLQNFSRPTQTRASSASYADLPSPLLPPAPVSPGPSSPSSRRSHGRKTSQGRFEPSLSSSSTLPQLGMAPAGQRPTANPPPSASQIAAQAAVLTHKQATTQHSRQRSQTVPVHNTPEPGAAQRRAGASSTSSAGGERDPLSPPLVSLTEASAPRESGFESQAYRNGLMGSHAAAATTAANVVFPRSGPSSPSHHSQSQLQSQHQHQPQQAPPPVPEKPAKEKKGRLFSRPRKISTKGETDEKPLSSPGKIGSALSALQRANFSTSSLVDSAGALYTHGNSSSATIRPMDAPAEKEVREKEKKHHFLSRQKNKLKEEYNLASSSGGSKAPESHGLSSLYNLALPPSPGTNTTAFPKSIGGLDLRHGGRRDKRKEEKPDRGDAESIFASEPGSFGSHSASTTFLEPLEPGRYGLSSMAYDDAWPFLKAKMLVVFEGEDLRLPVEDFNRVVLVHIQYCIQRRSPNIILDDVRDLLGTGFSSLDRALRRTPEERVIPALVELWLFTFTVILPYMQAVFLPLDLEFAGCGTLLTPDKAKDFWGEGPAPGKPVDVRGLVLNAYRDIVILPRYETLRTIFSRLSLEFLPSSLASMALASPPPEAAAFPSSPSDSFASLNRPGTAASLDPAQGSYGSAGAALLGERDRAASNVSYGSEGARPFTPSSLQALGEGAGARGRERNAEDSKQVAELAGRMLQCMSVLASVGAGGPVEGEEGGGGGERGMGEQGGMSGLGVVGMGGEEEMREEMSGDEKMEELCRLLKLNWLGRGRTGRNRRGFVGGRVKRGQGVGQGEVRVA